MTVYIINKTWKVDLLNITSSTPLVKALIYDYLDNPYCRPYDYIVNEKISDLEKAAFIYTLLK